MTNRKQVFFGAGDKELLEVAETKDNFSVYVKELITADIAEPEEEEKEEEPVKKRVYQPNIVNPKLYIKKVKRALPYVGVR